MATPVHIPRVNNNDDEVKLVGAEVRAGDRVSRGQVLGQVETDKSVVDIEAPEDGFVLGMTAAVGDTVSVGSVWLWLGQSAGELMPVASAAASIQAKSGDDRHGRSTARARLLLQEHGLDANAIPCSGDRLLVADVERYLANERPLPNAARTPRIETVPEIEGQLRNLRNDERGMLSTVLWHRDVAAPGYVELEYDTSPWEEFAKQFADTHKLLLSPLLALMAWRLVEVAREVPILNSTLVGERRLEYSVINLGFTVQAGDTLYLGVIGDAASLGETEFVNAMGDMQRRAMAHKLGPRESQGATVGFSSMARWKINRHIPLLAPNTALMVAHAFSSDRRAVLGASYDHRVLNGFHVAAALRKLTKPRSVETAKAIAHES